MRVWVRAGLANVMRACMDTRVGARYRAVGQDAAGRCSGRLI